MPAFVAIFLAGTLGRAASKPLWHDEIFTLYLGTRTTVTGLWDALRAGADLNPPLYHLAVRMSAVLVGPGPLAARLPALLGFAGASVALYVFLRRRLGSSFALMGALIPSLTGLYLYAYEGRPYGLVLGFSAIALVAWQQRGEHSSRGLAPFVCSLMLMAATATHYYAVLMLMPLAAGELIRTRIRQRVDWPMLLAIASGMMPLLPFWPLIGAAREFAPGFWSRPAPDQLTDLYGQLFQPLALLVLAGAVLMTGASLMDRVWQRSREMTPAPQDADHHDLPPDEMAAALMLLALPAAGYALAVAATGAFHGRYVLQVVLGLGILAAWWAARLVRSRREAAILLAVLFLACGARLGAGVLSLGREPADPLATHTPLISKVPAGAPIVVSHALTFLQMVHYSGREAGTRLTYLTRPADVVEGLGVDTGGRALRRLAKVAPLEIREYDEFVGAHHQFHVYGPKSWLIPKLLSQSAQVRLLAEGEDGSLYAVEIRR